MCGIAGIWLKQAADTGRLDRAVAHFRASMHHRGPDAFGVHLIPGRAAFVNLRLAIVDRASSGNQPFYAPDGQRGIVYNGEVYNWEALRAPLEDQYPFKSHTDTEVVLARHVQQGDASFADLNGMFGLCIWNEAESSFVLARDRFGAKPLYIYEDDQCIAFASELKGLLGLDGLDLAPDAAGLQDYLAYRYNLAPRTLFKRIEKLPAGHFVRFSQGRRQTLQAFARLEITEPEQNRPEHDYVEELDALLGASVKSQLMGEVPIGVLLSGGLDSSSIAAYVHKAGAHLKAYSIGFPEVNEFAFSRDVAQRFELDYVELCITQDELRGGMDRVLRELDEPIADPACFALSRLAQRISQDVTVVLSGEGGDELFAGYGHHQLATVPGLGREQAFAEFFQRSANNIEAPQWLRDKALPLQHLRFRPHFDRSDSLLSGMQNFELHTWLPEDLMMKADKIAMAHSLEGRFPFLDVPLFEFAAKLPRALKIPQPGASKHVLRQLMQPQLPRSVLERPKMGFTVPPSFFLAPLRERLMGAIEQLSRSTLDSVMDLQAVRATLSAYYEQPGSVPVFKAWNLAVLLLWWAEVLPSYLRPTASQSPSPKLLERSVPMSQNDTSAKFKLELVDENEHLIPRPYGTLQTLNLDHLYRYAYAKGYCYNADVLDAAMGCGYPSLILNCKTYSGVDIDPNMVAFANEHYLPMMSNATYVQGSVLDLPFENHSKDVYISYETIEHIQPNELPQYFAEVKRVLRPGGKFICSTPIYRGDKFGLLTKYHPYEFRYAQFEATLVNQGFQLLDTLYQWPPHFTLEHVQPSFAQTQQAAPFLTICVCQVG